MNKVVFIVCIVLFSACHHKDLTSTTGASKTHATTINAGGIKEVVIDATLNIYAIGAYYKMDSMEINNDTLSVFVAYSGGCKEHDWSLFTNGVYNKVHPPEITICLKHNNNGDACRQIIKKELKFNIAKLKYRRKKTVVVILGGNEVDYKTR
jgi:hypothetical protein